MRHDWVGISLWGPPINGSANSKNVLGFATYSPRSPIGSTAGALARDTGGIALYHDGRVFMRDGRDRPRRPEPMTKINLEAAKATMGAIDLDPASSAEANETVEAEKFYTKEDNGLQLPWKGRIWLNPPYGGDARLFIERMLKEYKVGNVTAACALLNSHPTETKWFQQLFDYPIYPLEPPWESEGVPRVPSEAAPQVWDTWNPCGNTTGSTNEGREMRVPQKKRSPGK